MWGDAYATYGVYWYTDCSPSVDLGKGGSGDEAVASAESSAGSGDDAAETMASGYASDSAGYAVADDSVAWGSDEVEWADVVEGC